MFPVMGSPKCVAFRSKHTGKYLQSVHEGSEDRAHGGGKFFFSEVSGAGANDEEQDDDEEEQDVGVLASPYTRFYLEPSKEHEGLLHVRCCHNNKYWVAKHGGDGSGHWTIGLINEPDGDISKSSCTLFEPVPLTGMDNNLSVRFFRPEQTESGARAVVTSQLQEAYLRVGTAEEDVDQEKSLHEFSAVELPQLVWPRNVAFKGDNDMYLRARVIKRKNYLEFSASDIGDPTVVNTISRLYPGGIIQIKSSHHGKCWSRNPDWVWADATDLNHIDTRFKVVEVSNYLALQNMGNHKFCRRLSAKKRKDCLSADMDSITSEARIWVEEAVLERKIYNVSFRLSDARIYGETPLYIPTVSSTNRTSEPNTVTLTMEYSATESRSFSSTVGRKVGMEAKFSAGIPIIAEGEVTMSTEASMEHEWGKTSDETTTLVAKYEATVPPMSRVIVRASATQGFVDVPFSYMQRDVLTTGQVDDKPLHDGLFTGVNSYNIQYQVTEEPI